MRKLIETFTADDPRYVANPKSSYEKAKAALWEYGQALVKNQLNNSLGMTIHKVPKAGVPKDYWQWGVYVEDLEVKK